MTAILEIDSYDGVVSRPLRRRAPVNTNPLALDRGERTAVENVAAQIALHINKTSLTTYEQMNAFHACVVAIGAAGDGDWKALAAAAQSGIEAAARVQGVSCVLLHCHDGANREIASDERADLHRIAMRLAHAAPGATRAEEDRARCLRAAVHAAIAADRGLLHIVRENLGCILRTLAHEECPFRRQIVWTDGLLDLARRHRNACVKVL